MATRMIAPVIPRFRFFSKPIETAHHQGSVTLMRSSGSCFLWRLPLSEKSSPEAWLLGERAERPDLLQVLAARCPIRVSENQRGSNASWSPFARASASTLPLDLDLHHHLCESGELHEDCAGWEILFSQLKSLGEMRTASASSVDMTRDA